MGSKASDRIDLCRTSDVAEGHAFRVQTHGLTLAVFNVEGNFYVTDDHCTHGPGSLSQGWLEGHQIVCEFHQGRFDVRTGQVAGPPPMDPVRNYKVIVSGDRVMIEV